MIYSKYTPAQEAQQLRVIEINEAIKLLRRSLRTEPELISVLHCVGGAISKSNGGIEKQDAELMQKVVDVLTYRTSIEVEELIDFLGTITTMEVSE
jgi:lipopolysaccharide biosynthesis regulator YciM